MPMNPLFDAAEKAADQLSANADAVIVFACVTEQGDTKHISTGRGNWYARFAMVREWLIREEEKMRQSVAEEDDD